MLPWSAQLELVRSIWVYREVARDLGDVLKRSHFENPVLGHLSEILVKLWSEGTQPTEGQVRAEVSKLTPQLEASILSYLEDVVEAPVPEAGWAMENGRLFAAQQETMILTGQLPEIAKAGEFQTLKTRAELINRMASNTGDMFSGMEDIDEVIERQRTTTRSLPTGILRVDDNSNGGLERGQRGDVLGKKGGGKTHTLVSIGTFNLLAGRRVFHATTEDSAAQTRARYDRSLTNLPSTQLIELAPFQFEFLKEMHSRLTVIDLRAKATSVSALYSALDRLKAGQEPDLVIVDYLQKFRVKGQTLGDSGARRAMLVSGAEELEQIAAERDVALWNGWQANRYGIINMRGREQKLLDIADYAECIEAAYSAAMILSINKNLTEEGTNLGKVYIAENRNGAAGISIEAIMDWRVSRVRDQLDPEVAS